MAMGNTNILKYFKPVRSSSSSITQTLPDPDGPLSERVPAKAIELANAEVKQSEESSRGRRPPYLILTPSQHYIKWVDEHRNWCNCFFKILF